jgi:hypothetical protein
MTTLPKRKGFSASPRRALDRIVPRGTKTRTRLQQSTSITGAESCPGVRKQDALPGWTGSVAHFRSDFTPHDLYGF